MKRNAIIALFISILAMNLPFWQWENRIQFLTGILLTWMMTFIFLVGTERREER